MSKHCLETMCLDGTFNLLLGAAFKVFSNHVHEDYTSLFVLLDIILSCNAGVRGTFHIVSFLLFCTTGIHCKCGQILQYPSGYQDTQNELQWCLTFEMCLCVVMSYDTTIVSVAAEIAVSKFIVCTSPTEYSPNLWHQTTVQYVSEPSLSLGAHHVSVHELCNTNQAGTVC